MDYSKELIFYRKYVDGKLCYYQVDPWSFTSHSPDFSHRDWYTRDRPCTVKYIGSTLQASSPKVFSTLEEYELIPRADLKFKMIARRDPVIRRSDFKSKDVFDKVPVK